MSRQAFLCILFSAVPHSFKPRRWKCKSADGRPDHVGGIHLRGRLHPPGYQHPGVHHNRMDVRGANLQLVTVIVIFIMGS